MIAVSNTLSDLRLVALALLLTAAVGVPSASASEPGMTIIFNGTERITVREAQISRLEAGKSAKTKKPLVTLCIEKKLAKVVGDLTLSNIGKEMVLEMGCQPVLRSIISEPILGGCIEMQAQDEKRAEELLKSLRVGLKAQCQAKKTGRSATAER